MSLLSYATAETGNGGAAWARAHARFADEDAARMAELDRLVKSRARCTHCYERLSEVDGGAVGTLCAGCALVVQAERERAHAVEQTRPHRGSPSPRPTLAARVGLSTPPPALGGHDGQSANLLAPPRQETTMTGRRSQPCTTCGSYSTCCACKRAAKKRPAVQAVPPPVAAEKQPTASPALDLSLVSDDDLVQAIADARAELARRQAEAETRARKLRDVLGQVDAPRAVEAVG